MLSTYSFRGPASRWRETYNPLRGLTLSRVASLCEAYDRGEMAEALEAMVRRFAEEVHEPGFAGMLVDQEHFSHHQDKQTRAFGWLTALQARADGLYGQIRWTTTGRAAVDGGDYRFFSTEYEAGDLAEMQNEEGKMPNAKAWRRVRPLRLAGLALTNKPNNQGCRPITNRGGELAEKHERSEGGEEVSGSEFQVSLPAIFNLPRLSPGRERGRGGDGTNYQQKQDERNSNPTWAAGRGGRSRHPRRGGPRYKPGLGTGGREHFAARDVRGGGPGAIRGAFRRHRARDLARPAIAQWEFPFWRSR